MAGVWVGVGASESTNFAIDSIEAKRWTVSNAERVQFRLLNPKSYGTLNLNLSNSVQQKAN